MSAATKRITHALAAMLLSAVSQAWAGVTVSLTAPANGSVHAPGANITLSAAASATGGYTVSKVEFFHGSTLIGTDTSAPYSINWNNVPQGSYTLTVKATATKTNLPDQTATSSPHNIAVTLPPTSTLTSPADGSNLPTPTITMNATASDSDGSIAVVRLYYEESSGAEYGMVTLTQPPYTATVTVAPMFCCGVGGTMNYQVVALAEDNNGAAVYSNSASVTVPIVGLATPSPNATFIAPATILLRAEVANYGPVSHVEFYQGSALIGTVTSEPYTFAWTGVPQGTYDLTARATYFDAAIVTSPVVSITVNSSVAKLHFIHVNHLNTPRLVANQSGQAVWRWDQQEPFGDTPPDENPSGLGIFEFPLRFGGLQYFDRETGRFHVGARSYSSQEGRFLQSDPAGMDGDINSYAYSENAPVDGVDTDGERRFPQRKKGAPNSPQNPAKKTGNCSPAMHSFLQGLVNFWCSKPHHCSPSDSCPENKLKIKVASNCATARRNINQQCYNGGDAGHKIAEENAKNAVKNCIALQPVCCKD